mmetsp:Transcript_35037/g.87793  ORF Transcript_35037/g.87793 Transcript_35037/m.87793 type:complete len:351 (-) Transcript_35037:1418-2470(-)
MSSCISLSSRSPLGTSSSSSPTPSSAGAGAGAGAGLASTLMAASYSASTWMYSSNSASRCDAGTATKRRSDHTRRRTTGHAASAARGGSFRSSSIWRKSTSRCSAASASSISAMRARRAASSAASSRSALSRAAAASTLRASSAASASASPRSLSAWPALEPPCSRWRRSWRRHLSTCAAARSVLRPARLLNADVPCWAAKPVMPVSLLAARLVSVEAARESAVPAPLPSATGSFVVYASVSCTWSISSRVNCRRSVASWIAVITLLSMLTEARALRRSFVSCRTMDGLLRAPGTISNVVRASRACVSRSLSIATALPSVSRMAALPVPTAYSKLSVTRVFARALAPSRK